MKFKKVFICSACGYVHYKWQGQCASCGKWNTLVEDVLAEKTKAESKKISITDFSSPAVTLDKAYETKLEKISSGINEFDRVLGGGIISGQVLLLAGPPGIGKSTLMLEAADGFSKSKNEKILYASGEESVSQIFSRANRLEIKNPDIILLSETNLLTIIENIKKYKPNLLILDSIQTVYHPDIPSSSGSITQIKECAWELLKIAKQNSITLFILGHITKEGELAGPKILEHMVDTVLYFDSERTGIYRILRAYKNRFGDANEIGIFEMTSKGLISADNYFNAISEEKENLAGRAHTILFEGSRPILSKVEVLANRTFYPYPKRVFTGMDSNRAQILIAAIEKSTQLSFNTLDIFASIAGGFKTSDTAIDLAFCAGLYSSIKDIPLPYNWAFIGEVGILSQLYSVPNISRRINEAVRLGFKKIFIPQSSKLENASKAEIVKVKDIKQLFENLKK